MKVNKLLERHGMRRSRANALGDGVVHLQNFIGVHASLILHRARNVKGVVYRVSDAGYGKR